MRLAQFRYRLELAQFRYRLELAHVRYRLELARFRYRLENTKPQAHCLPAPPIPTASHSVGDKLKAREVRDDASRSQEEHVCSLELEKDMEAQ